MHNKNDLKEMDIEQLRSIASGLEVKGFKKMEKDDLVYAILDHAAAVNAKNAPEKPERKKRGRPKKEKSVEKPAEAAPIEETVQVSVIPAEGIAEAEKPASEKAQAETPSQQQKKRGKIHAEAEEEDRPKKIQKQLDAIKGQRLFSLFPRCVRYQYPIGCPTHQQVKNRPDDGEDPTRRG